MPTLSERLARWRAHGGPLDDQLTREVYPYLLALARRQLRRRGHPISLRATEIAHETYLRLIEQRSTEWQSFGHFLALVATVVRRVIGDYARQRSADKRGSDFKHVALDDMLDAEHPQGQTPEFWLALERALAELETDLPELARLVELRLYCGLDVSEVAEVIERSERTVTRQWRFAQAFLANRILH